MYWYYDSDATEINAVKRYYALMQYSKFIKAGDVRVDLQWLNASSAYGDALSGTAFLRSDGTVTIVLVNNSDNAYPVNIAGGYTNMQIVTTDNNYDCETTYNGAFRQNVSIGAKTVNKIDLS